MLLSLLMVLMLCAMQALSPASTSGQAGEEPRLTVYFANWNVYASPSAQVKNLPWDRLDCIHHAFWKITPRDGGYALVSTDASADFGEGNPRAHFPQYAAYAKKYPQVEILLSIGGWTCSGYFSEMCLTEGRRSSLIQSCLEALDEYPFFSGLDIDWEYPGVSRKGSGKDEGNPVAGDDKANYTLFLKELRSALDRHFGKGAKRLTVCAGAAVDILAHQDYATLHPFVDRISLMTYDMAGIGDAKAGHQTPLLGEPSVDSAVKYLLAQGVPARKIAIGSPLYSHGWKLADPEQAAVGAKGQAVSGANRLWKTVAKYESAAVPAGTPGWHAGYDEAAQAAYLWNDDPASADCRLFLTYESSRSLDAKLRYIREKGLGGLIVWEAAGDGTGFPMLGQAFRGLHP